MQSTLSISSSCNSHLHLTSQKLKASHGSSSSRHVPCLSATHCKQHSTLGFVPLMYSCLQTDNATVTNGSCVLQIQAPHGDHMEQAEVAQHATLIHLLDVVHGTHQRFKRTPVGTPLPAASTACCSVLWDPLICGPK